MKATRCTLYSTEPNFPPNYMTKSLIFKKHTLNYCSKEHNLKTLPCPSPPQLFLRVHRTKTFHYSERGTGTFLITEESGGRARLHVHVGVRAHVQVCVHACACACMHALVHCVCARAYTCAGMHKHAHIHTGTQKDNPVVPNPITEHRLHFLLRQGTQIRRDV